MITEDEAFCHTNRSRAGNTIYEPFGAARFGCATAYGSRHYPAAPARARPVHFAQPARIRAAPCLAAPPSQSFRPPQVSALTPPPRAGPLPRHVVQTHPRRRFECFDGRNRREVRGPRQPGRRDYGARQHHPADRGHVQPADCAQPSGRGRPAAPGPRGRRRGAGGRPPGGAVRAPEEKSARPPRPSWRRRGWRPSA